MARAPNRLEGFKIVCFECPDGYEFVATNGGKDARLKLHMPPVPGGLPQDVQANAYKAAVELWHAQDRLERLGDSMSDPFSRRTGREPPSE